jgi:hypothetical protein
MHTKFHKDWLRHSQVNRGRGIHRQTAWRSHKPTFIFQNKESRLKKHLPLHPIYTPRRGREDPHSGRAPFQMSHVRGSPSVPAANVALMTYHSYFVSGIFGVQLLTQIPAIRRLSWFLSSHPRHCTCLHYPF